MGRPGLFLLRYRFEVRWVVSSGRALTILWVLLEGKEQREQREGAERAEGTGDRGKRAARRGYTMIGRARRRVADKRMHRDWVVHSSLCQTAGKQQTATAHAARIHAVSDTPAAQLALPET